MEIVKTFQNFNAPVLDDFELRLHHSLQVLPQRATGDHLCDEMNLVLFFTDPGRDEVNYVGIVQLLDDVDLRFDPRPLSFW